MAKRRTRRRLVSTLGTAAVAALAGCFSITESESTGSSGTPTPTDPAQSPTPERVPPRERTATVEATQPEPDPSPPPAVDAHLAEASNYDGTVVDVRGQETVTVDVGVEANGGPFGFGPPALHVDTGTNVQWEWVTDGASHSVESTEDGPLDSGSAVDDSGVNYEFTFETDGIYNYVCVPHEGLGMKGSVVVGSDYPTTE